MTADETIKEIASVIDSMSDGDGSMAHVLEERQAALEEIDRLIERYRVLGERAA